MILKDPQLIKEISSEIDSGKDAFDAISFVFDKYINALKLSNDSYLYERYLDLVDVKGRVLANLNEKAISFANIPECILYVDELLPSYLIDMSKGVKGIISKIGGFTSHSAIICRSLNIPYVVAEVPDDFDGKVLIDDGKIILNPSKEEIQTVDSKEEDFKCDLGDIKVYANVASLSDTKNIPEEFSGVGLFRTEFLLMNSLYAFSYEMQLDVYKKALKNLKGKEIVFRTFDIGDDKKVSYLPRLSRGVSNYLKYSKLFETQIKALLLASSSYPGQVKIMFPMIESVEEFYALKKIVVKISRSLNVKLPPLGIMLETQRALINIEDFSKVDFISIGTNDLTSELFNINREKALLYDDYIVDLIDSLKNVIEFSKRKQIPLSVCGEVIINKEFSTRMFALGLNKVSISTSNIKYIYQSIGEQNEKH